MNAKTGGPAFPQQDAVASDGSRWFDGMTLRDYFAAKAMQSYVVHDKAYDFDDISEMSYRIADAMLKAGGHDHPRQAVPIKAQPLGLVPRQHSRRGQVP